MKNFISSVSILLLFISSHSKILAQSDFSLQMRGGASLIGENKILKYWNRGWNVGVGLEYRLASMIFISGDIIFHRFSFNKNSSYQELVIPEIMSELRGESSNIYETSCAFRFASDKGIVRPFIILRSGIYFIHTGQFDVISWDFMYPLPPPNAKIIHISEQKIQRWFVSLGIGLEMLIHKDWNIVIEPSFSQTNPFDLSLLPINVFVQYKL